MNSKEFNIVKDFIQEVLGAKNPEDFIFDPEYRSHPKQDFPDIAYEIASRVVNRFDFIDWEDIEKEDYWIWGVILTELEQIAVEESDSDKEPWMESPLQ